MAGRLTAAASHILGGGGGAAVRASASALRHRAGMGLPVGRHIVPEKPLPTNDELVWDNGTPYPEPCIDRLAPHIGKYEALAWLCGGLGFFATLGLAAALNDKASKIPYENIAGNERSNGSKLVARYDKVVGKSASAEMNYDPGSILDSITPKVYPYDNLRAELGDRP
ncbi:hypothetical protein ACP70R_019617 [Stipagrostis hirtigluma subsp. patula]